MFPLIVVFWPTAIPGAKISNILFERRAHGKIVKEVGIAAVLERGFGDVDIAPHIVQRIPGHLHPDIALEYRHRIGLDQLELDQVCIIDLCVEIELHVFF